MTTENVLINIREDGARVVVVNITAIANASANAESSVNSLKRALGGISVAYLAKQFFEMADAVNMMDSRLRLVTKSVDEFKEGQKEIYRISQQNNVSLQETTRLYSRLVDPVKTMGGSIKEVTGITEAFSSALKAQGVTTAEGAAATIQFSQAMNKGKLDGDEFRTMAETAPRVMRAFADGMGVAYGSLKTLSIQGKLTSDVLSNALLKQLKTLKEEAKQVGDTVGGAFSDLSNDTILAAGAFDKMTGASRMTADAINGVSLIVFQLAEVFRDELKKGTKDANGEFDTMSNVIRGIGTIMEAVLILASDVAHIFKTLGRAIGGFAAQVAMAAQGNWQAVADIQKDLVSKNEQGLKDLDAYQAKILKITDKALDARSKLRDDANKPATDYSFKQLESVASEDKLIETRMRLAGITKNYYEDLGNLQSAYDSGKMSLKEYTGALGELAKKTWDNSAAGKAEQKALKNHGDDDRLKKMQNSLTVEQGLLEKEQALYNNRTQMLDFYNSKLGLSDDEYYKGQEAARQDYVSSLESSFAREKAIINSFKPKNDKEEADKSGRLIKLSQEYERYFAEVAKARQGDVLNKLATDRMIEISDQDRQSEFLATEYEMFDALEKSNNIRIRSASNISKETEALLRQAIVKQQLQNLEPITKDHTDADVQQGQKIIQFLTAQLGIREKITGQLVIQERLIAKDKEALRAIDDWKNAGKDIAESLKSSFGSVGESVGQVFKTFADGMADQLEMAYKLEKQIKGMDLDDPERERLIAENREKSAQAQIKSFGDMTGAAKGFFKENSTGYKVLEATEKAFRIFELTMAVTTMAKKLMVEKAATTASVANAGKEASSWGITAVVKAIASMPYPYNIAAGIATAAAVIGIGAKLNGSISAGGISSDKVQETQGTGTVFGNDTAKSASIANTIEKLSNSSSDLIPINQGMLSALKNIESAMVGFKNIIARATGVADGSSFGIKTGQLDPGKPVDFIGHLTDKLFDVIAPGAIGDKISKMLINLWGKTTQNIVDSGLMFGGSLRDLQAGKGVQQYASVDTTKSSFFGLSKKTTNSVQTADVNSEISNQLGLIFKNAETVLIQNAKGLGIAVDTVVTALDGVKIDPTKLSLKGLSGDALTEAINAVISKTLDEMASAVFPEMEKFRQVGEGYSETVMRLASDYAIVDSVMESLGGKFGEVGVGSLEARENLIALSGGIENFSSQSTKFAKDFLTEAEQLAPTSKYVASELERLGYAGLTTRDQFKDVIVGLVKSGATATASGAETYAGLMNIADAFAKVTPAIKATGDSAYSAAGIIDERNSLQSKYDELTLSSTELEKKRGESIHSTNKELYESVVTATHAKEATEELNKTNKTLQDKIDSLYKASLPLNKQRELEVAGMDASTLKLYERVEALTEEAKAFELVKTKFQNMTEVLAASLKLAEDMAQKAMDAVTAAVNNEKEIAQNAYNDKINDLDAREKNLRKTYDHAVDAINASKTLAKAQYDKEIKALEDAKKEAVNSYKTAVDNLKAAEKTALGLYKDAVKALGTEKENVIKTYQEAVKAITAQIKSASENVSKLTKLSESLSSTLDGMRMQGSEGSYRAQAQAQIQQFLAIAKAGGSLPDESQISSALKTVSTASQDLFSTFEDYQFDFYRTATDIRDLNDIADNQLLKAQTELDVLEATKEQMATEHDEILAKFDAQREALDAANELRVAAFDAQLEAMATAQDKLLESFDNQKQSLDNNYDTTTNGFEEQLKRLADNLEQSLGGIDSEREAAKKILDTEIARLDDALKLAQKQLDTQLGIWKAVLPLEEAIKGLSGAVKNVAQAQTAVVNPVNMSQADTIARQILNQISTAGGYETVQSQNASLIAAFGPSLEQIAKANQLYIQVLGRNAEGNSAAALAAQMKNGLSESAAIDALKGSKEYEARQISVDLQKQVNRLVNAVLNNGINSDSLFIDGSHAQGLGYVPWDGYIAKLHRGEMVVPAEPAGMMRAAGGGGGGGDGYEAMSALLSEFREYRTDQRIADAAIAANTAKTANSIDNVDKRGVLAREEP